MALEISVIIPTFNEAPNIVQTITLCAIEQQK